MKLSSSNPEDQTKIKITEGLVPSPKSLKIEVLHEQPGLCAWVGKRNSKGQIVDAIPVFTAGNALTEVTAGTVLLTDLARDLTVEQRLAGHNFAIANFREIPEHFRVTYGYTTERIINQEYLSGALGPKISKFLAARFTRILKVNYLEGANLFEQNEARIRLKKPFKLLTRFDSDTKARNIMDFAVWLGKRWLEAESTLLQAYPHLSDRSLLFKVTEEP
jgi:hypothetical protein